MTTQLKAQQAFAATTTVTLQGLKGAPIAAGSSVTLKWERSYLEDRHRELRHVYSVFGFDTRNRYTEAAGVPETLLESIYFLTCENISK